MGDEPPATLAEQVSQLEKHPLPAGAISLCENGGGRRYVKFQGGSNITIRTWMYDAQTGAIVYVKSIPWESPPCLLTTVHGWRPACGHPEPATLERLREWAPVLATPPVP